MAQWRHQIFGYSVTSHTMSEFSNWVQNSSPDVCLNGESLCTHESVLCCLQSRFLASMIVVVKVAGSIKGLMVVIFSCHTCMNGFAWACVAGEGTHQNGKSKLLLPWTHFEVIDTSGKNKIIILWEPPWNLSLDILRGRPVYKLEFSLGSGVEIDRT